MKRTAEVFLGFRAPTSKTGEPHPWHNARMTDESRLPDPPEWNWREEQEKRQAKQVEGDKVRRLSTTQMLMERNIGLGIAIGYSFVGPVLGGMLLGLWLDGWSPGGYTILDLLLGMAGALTLLIRLVARINRES